MLEIGHDKGKCMRVLVLFRPLPNVGIQIFGMWGMFNLAKAYRSIKNPSPIAESRTGKPAMFTSTVPLSMTRPCGRTYLCAAILGCGTGPRFTNGFSIPIKIRWKFHFTLISILIQWSLQNFVQGTTAVLSWHVQKFVAIWWPTTEYGPVTMIVLASGHQVRCIPWVQMDTFNKEIGFLCGLKFFALNIFCANTYNRVHISCCKYGDNRYCERCANK